MFSTKFSKHFSYCDTPLLTHKITSFSSMMLPCGLSLRRACTSRKLFTCARLYSGKKGKEIVMEEEEEEEEEEEDM